MEVKVLGPRSVSAGKFTSDLQDLYDEGWRLVHFSTAQGTGVVYCTAVLERKKNVA